MKRTRDFHAYDRPSGSTKRPRDSLTRLSCYARDYVGIPFPQFRKPQIIGSFSVDANREFVDDRSQLKFFNPPNNRETRVRLDLNRGLDEVVRKDEDKCKEERLSMMLKWITINKERFAVGGDKSSGRKKEINSLNTDFVCFRGLLTQLMCTPYENREGWRVLAVRHRGTIYLHKDETEEAKRQRLQASDRLKAMQSWGYKFEQCMMSDTVNGQPDPSPPVVESEEFCCMFRTRLGAHSIVYGAEMDGLEVNDRLNGLTGDVDGIDLNGETFVELKTSRIVEHPGQERTLKKFKQIKWWCQSFLVGVPTIVCGFRDDDGIVEKVVQYSVNDLPKSCSEHWQPNVCMAFLDAALAHIKTEMSQVNEDVAVSFNWDPRGMQISKRIENQHSCDILLPKWYKSDVFESFPAPNGRT